MSIFLIPWFLLSCNEEDNPGDNGETIVINVITGDAADIDPASAKLSGTCTIENAKAANGEVCFYYAKKSGDAKELAASGKKIDAGSVSSIGGSFTITISNLEPSTVYYFVAGVTIDEKEFFGGVKSFKTAEKPKELTITGTADQITELSAILTGYANPTPELGNVTMGILCSKEESPSLDNSIKLTSQELDGNNMYSVKAKDLSSNTIYFFKSFIEYGGVYRSGEVKSFKTLDFKVNVATKTATNVGLYAATLNGNLSVESVSELDKSVYFYYGQQDNLDDLRSKGERVSATLNEDGSFFANLSGLEYNKKYQYVACSKVHDKEATGEVSSFTTNDIGSLIETKDASDIEATNACLNAKLDLTNSPYTDISYGFLWGESEEALSTKIDGGELKDNSFSAVLTGLSHKTQYWYKAFVQLDDQTFYGEVRSFTSEVVHVESISLNFSEFSIYSIGDWIRLSAIVLPADATDKSVAWSSDNESVASVDQNGTVNAVGNGTATITVTTKDQGKTATCTITVAQWITGITLGNGFILTLNEGQEQTLIATVNPDNAANKTLKWTSSDESVATVDQTGKVTAVSKGSATIKAEANDGSGRYASCRVLVNRLVSSIELDKTSITVYNGKTETITATITPSSATDTSVSWTSSNPYVAEVSSSGVVTGQSRGTATITVTANDGSGVTATCEVEVKQYVTSITLSKTSLYLVIGADETISVTSVLPDNANDKSYTWSSSDNSIASVDQNGKVTAKAKGNALIKATSNDGSGVFASCAVGVKNPCPPGAVDLGLSVHWASCNLSESGFVSSSEEYGDYYAWGETKTKSNYSWSTYKFGTTSSGSIYKYNTLDNKMVLDPEDDVAHVKLGGKWRVPTFSEWAELLYLENCTWTWTTQNGVNGRLVTSKTNGNSIFLPAAGHREFTGLYGEGSYGLYWSSSLDTDPSRAWYFYLGGDSDDAGGSVSYRDFGLSVRPVSE